MKTFDEPNKTSADQIQSQLPVLLLPSIGELQSSSDLILWCPRERHRAAIWGGDKETQRVAAHCRQLSCLQGEIGGSKLVFQGSLHPVCKRGPFLPCAPVSPLAKQTEEAGFLPVLTVYHHPFRLPLLTRPTCGALG